MWGIIDFISLSIIINRWCKVFRHEFLIETDEIKLVYYTTLSIIPIRLLHSLAIYGGVLVVMLVTFMDVVVIFPIFALTKRGAFTPRMIYFALVMLYSIGVVSSYVQSSVGGFIHGYLFETALVLLGVSFIDLYNPPLHGVRPIPVNIRTSRPTPPTRVIS